MIRSLLCLLPLVLLGLGLPLPARGEALVLVHGYVSGYRTWADSGLLKTLQEAGWRDGGGYTAGGPEGLRPSRIPQPAGSRVVYRADLPSEAPLPVQAQWLKVILDAVKTNHPKEKLLAVGHSAGGVALRLAMVRNPTLGLHGLITIASPHLGTDRAVLGRLLGATPLALFAPLVGADTLNRSQELYQDLLPETDGSPLFRLNRSPHPPAHYISIIHAGDGLMDGDALVPTRSQDLRQVAALGNRAVSHQIQGDHGLTAADGVLLVRLIETVLKEPIPPGEASLHPPPMPAAPRLPR